jgi:hypothetical protein
MVLIKCSILGFSKALAAKQTNSVSNENEHELERASNIH